MAPHNKPSKQERWLLVTVSSTGSSSTLRVHAWRKLRSLGGVYLHNSVALLPDRPATRRSIQRLVDRVNREGGQARVLNIAVLEPGQERELVTLFQDERADEYAEVRSRTPAFLEEIETERRRGRATYAEVEESEADLERLRTWLARIQGRDYFGAPGASEAAAAVEECAHALAAFEEAALAAEVPDSSPAPSTGKRAARSLRAVNDA